MRVVLDIQGTQSRAHGDRGIARYLRELSGALAQWHPQMVDAFVLNPDLPPPGGIETLSALGHLARTDAVGRVPGSAVYHVGSPFEHVPIDRLWPPQARSGRMRLVVTVYDLIPEVFPDFYLASAPARRWYSSRIELIRRADRVFAISHATANDVITRLGLREEKVVMVGAGVSDRFRPPDDHAAALRSATQAVPGLARGYVLYTGGIDARKNITRLLEAYALLSPELRAAHELVIVCRVLPNERAALEHELAELKITGRVRFPGFVSDEDLITLYQACHLFVFPSLYEGFGLPVAEALACGAPVIAAGSSSLVELVADEAQFDPTDSDVIAAAMRAALTDEDLRARLRREGKPTWRGVADRTVEAYEELEPPQPMRRRRLRVAFVSPLPPQRSGVADASYRLIGELTRYFEVDAFADGDGERGTAPPGVSLASVSAFDRCERARGTYDQVIYALGNSEYHAGALALLKERPGIVLAHDLRLSGLYSWTAQERPDLEPRSFHAIIQAMYRDRVPPALGRHGWVDLDDAERYGIFMTQEVIAASERFLVHSRYAEQLARIDAKPEDVSKIGVLPFGIVSPDSFFEQRDESDFIVATFGIVAPVKQPQKIVEAFARIAGQYPQAKLAVVGRFLEDRDRALVLRRAEELGIRDRLTSTGRVSETEFHQWLARTTIAVQLRSWSSGETSAAVADCLAAGIPTVVSDIGSAAELPDDCVVKVDREISPERLGNELAALFENPQRRFRLSEAGRSYARSRAFRHVAARLSEVVVALHDEHQGNRRAAHVG
jgi:glycosyltransferase involved in cell wall biosynthesis